MEELNKSKTTWQQARSVSIRLASPELKQQSQLADDAAAAGCCAAAAAASAAAAAAKMWEAGTSLGDEDLLSNLLVALRAEMTSFLAAFATIGNEATRPEADDAHTTSAHVGAAGRHMLHPRGALLPAVLTLVHHR